MSEGTVLLIRPSQLNTTRAQRTALEQVLVRFPLLARALGSLTLRLPLRSRLRRFFLLRIAETAAAAVNRQDFDLLFKGFDPEIEVKLAAGLYPPDLSGDHHGHGGYRELWRKLLEVWVDLRMQPEELIDTGDRLISLTRVTAQGAGSGAPIDITMFQVFAFWDGLVVRQADVKDRKEALRAAGLSE
jgi:SnoaL-like domain